MYATILRLAPSKEYTLIPNDVDWACWLDAANPNRAIITSICFRRLGSGNGYLYVYLLSGQRLTKDNISLSAYGAKNNGDSNFYYNLGISQLTSYKIDSIVVPGNPAKLASSSKPDEWYQYTWDGLPEHMILCSPEESQ